MSDSGGSDSEACASSIAPESPTSNSQPALSEISPGDKPWDKHRSFADRVEGLYAGSEFHDYSSRIHYCSDLLKFGLALQDDESLKLKLRSARFCRLRHCPVCQWRRSLMWKAKAYKVLPKIVAAYPTHRWLFVTLTIKNVPIAQLRDNLTQMNRGFQRLSQLKAFPALGWLRSTEVTRGRDGNAHPHFHCLMLVQPSYFGRNYIKQAEWGEMWRKSMRLDYNPVLDVQAVKQGSKPMELIPELLKYCLKESDLVADRDWLIELTRQMHKMRAVATGGVLKEYLKELEEEPEDLIGKDEEEAAAIDEAAVYFGWKRRESKYRMVDQSS
jgi:plasmid rolling circle replication initiator protein Rep